MPRRSAAQARQVKHATDLLFERLQAAIDSPELSDGAGHGLLADLIEEFAALQSAEDELMVLTERLAESDAAIRAERARYQELFEAAPDGYVVTDADGTVKEANGRARRLLGATGVAIEGTRLDSFFEGEERDLIWSVLTDLATGHPVDRFEVVLDGGHDHSRTIEVQVDGEARSDGDAADVRWLLRDITERVRLEREVQQLNADVDLLTSFADVSRLVTHTDDPTDTLLRGLVELATADEPGTRAAILLADERGTMQARAVSDPIAAELCAAEVEGGPANEALGSGRPTVYRNGELARWPSLAELVDRHGLSWVVAQPIGDGGPLTGVFIAFGSGSPAASERTTSLLAAHAGATIANRELYLSTRRLASHLENALHTRVVIEQAKGILMARQGCDPDTAFDVLRRASQRQNRKIHDLAEEIVARAPDAGPESSDRIVPPTPTAR